LAQLDERFEESYDHLLSANRGFLRGWYGQVNAKVVVDKNRAWLQAIEYLDQLEPSARVLVCVRELGQVYASIEAQHQRTLMLDFVDHLADLDRMGRADQLFSKERAIGAPLVSIQALVDLPGQIKKKLYFVKYEDLVRDPQKVMSSVCEWLGLNRLMIGTDKLKLGPRESDSHYRFKYLHTQHSSLKKVPQHAVPPRIQAHIEKAFAWYYETFYPSMRSPS
jgi:sulfotransferase